MKLIIVVDDLAIFREPLEEVLRHDGYQTMSADNGRHAMAIMATRIPDLVLLDLAMPLMDGLQVLEQMRASPKLKDVPVIILSAQGDKARIVEAAKLGVSGYILKSGFSLAAMRQKITDHFGTGPRDPEARAAAPSQAPSRTVAPPNRKITVDNAPAAVPAQPSAARHPNGSGNDPAAALRGLVPILTRDELLHRINACGELKGLSPVVAQVLTLTANPRCSSEAVAKAIGQDHAIALKILKLANSSVYTRGAPVDSVHKAVVRIGTDRIRQTVLNVSVVERFSAAAFDKHLSTSQFWEHAIACGLIAAELAHATNEKEADAAFTTGLLHDVGRLVMAEQLGEQYVQVIAAARRADLPLEQVESHMLGASHADVMDRVLRGWNFPKDLVKPILFHHLSLGNIRSAAPGQLGEVARLALANRFAHALMLGSSGNDAVYPTTEFCAALGIDPAVIARVQTVAQQQTDNMKFTMLSQSSGAAWPRRVDELRGGLRVALRPLFIGATPETDAFAVFCAGLADPPVDEPPNIAIVHIERATDRAALGAKLRSAEHEHGAPELPLLCLSPAGQWTLDLPTRASYCRQLPTPTTISRFIAAVNELVAEKGARAAA